MDQEDIVVISIISFILIVCGFGACHFARLEDKRNAACMLACEDARVVSQFDMKDKFFCVCADSSQKEKNQNS